MTQTPQETLKAVQQKKFAPIYLLHGDEPFYIDQIQEEIEEKALQPQDKAFNQFVVYGKDLNVGSLLSYVKRFPMMSDRQVVIVKEAQGLQGLETKESAKFLEDYFLNPLASTLLVLCFKDPVDERKSWVKAAGSKGVIVSSKKFYDNKLPDWILEQCHATGTKISPKAIQMLVESVGNDLKRLSSELDKIIINLQVGQEINAQIIEHFVGISKEYNYFEYQKALIIRDVMKANQIAYFFGKNPKDNPLPPILILLYNFFSKLLIVYSTQDKSENNLALVLGVRPFFTKDYLLAIRNYPLAKIIQIIKDIAQTDLKSKGVDAGTTNEAELLKELTFRILH